MAVKWDNYHVEYNPTGVKVVLRRLDETTGRTKEESEDRTEEVALALMLKMRQQVRRRNTNGKKPWCGFSLEGVGQLIFIEDGYGFKLVENPGIKRKKT